MPVKPFQCVIILLLVYLSSCDPGIGVVISNETTTDKRIKVIYPSTFKFPGETEHDLRIRDSIRTYDLTIADDNKEPMVIPISSWDTIARTYSFTLKANHEAWVEHRFLTSVPTYGQVFIVNDSDTVKFIRHGKDFRKTPKLQLGGTWRHRITDSLSLTSKAYSSPVKPKKDTSPVSIFDIIDHVLRHAPPNF